MIRSFMALAAIAVGVAPVTGENWPGWRGGDGSGVVVEANLPAEFSLERSWKAKLPGRGCSTPIVWEGTVFVTGPDEKTDTVFAFDLKNGKELWRKALSDAKLGRTQRIGSSANSSPLTDGAHVYAYFKSGTLAALDFEGKVAWQINVDETFAEDKILWDKGTSPVFANGNLVIAAMQQNGKSYLVSIDKKNGKKVWLTERPFKTEGETGDSYATPFVVTLDGVETIVTWGAHFLTGHDAKSGKQLWVCGGFNPTNHKVYRSIASASWTGDVAIVPFGREDFVAGIRMGGRGDITEKAWLWKHKGWGTDTTTPAAKEGKALVLCDRGKERGTLTLLEAESGKILWQEKLPKSVHNFCASPLVAGERFVVSREEGTIFTGKLTAEGMSDVKEIKLEEGIIASPVTVDGKVLIRGDQHLYCFW